MYVLLSSGSTKRYRDDILRCLATPFGVEVQFRYNANIVDESIKDGLSSIRKCVGIVCNVDINEKIEPRGTHRLIPVRRVVIERVWRSGSTITISMTMREFAHASDERQFTSQVASQCAHLPADAPADGESGGWWFFKITSQPNALTFKAELGTFEGITQQLATVTQFQEEPFFWTVLQVRKGSADRIEESDRISAWPKKIHFDRWYTLLIYVFRPLTSPDHGIGQLLLRSEPPFASLHGPEIIIDSPYDLKRWPFKIRQPHLGFRESGWLRIGQEAIRKGREANDRQADLSDDEINRELRGKLTGTTDWEINLPMRFYSSWFRILVVNIVLGALLAAPSIIAIWRQAGVPNNERLLSSLVALVFGVAAALVATFQVKRVA